jgi:hypothetical protein
MGQTRLRSGAELAHLIQPGGGDAFAAGDQVIGAAAEESAAAVDAVEEADEVFEAQGAGGGHGVRLVWRGMNEALCE